MNWKLPRKRELIMKINFEIAYDKVHWDFLEEVMKGKGLPDKWIDLVMQTVQGGQVSGLCECEWASWFLF